MSFTIGEISQSSRYRRWKEGRPLLRPLLSGERGRLRLPGYRVLRSIFAARSLCLLRCHHLLSPNVTASPLRLSCTSSWRARMGHATIHR
jgi:hypothetical protein